MRREGLEGSGEGRGVSRQGADLMGTPKERASSSVRWGKGYIILPLWLRDENDHRAGKGGKLDMPHGPLSAAVMAD